MNDTNIIHNTISYRRMNFRNKVLFLVCMLLASLGYGQSVSYLGIENGLSNNTVTSIHKDRFGLMWFGTLDGLNRYDGYSFRIFRNKFGDDTSLPNDVINAVSSDDQGNIWVGTQKGVGILSNKTLQFSKIRLSVKGTRSKIFSGWVNTLQKDAEGNMYVGTADDGLLICKKGSPETTAAIINNGPASNDRYTVTAICPAKGDQIWVGLEKLGLGLYNKQTNRITIINKRLHWITALCTDLYGNCWIGTKHGLFYYDNSSKRIDQPQFKEQLLYESNISGIIFDRQGQLWVTTNGDGLLQLKGILKQDYRMSRDYPSEEISSDALFTIFEDDWSRKWIGTLRGGIDIIDTKKNQFKTIAHDPGTPNTLVNNFTFSFCEDKDNNIWIGTDGGGLSIWNRKTNQFRNFVYHKGRTGIIGDNRIPSIVRDDQGDMWVGTFDAGVYKYDKHTQKFNSINFEDPNAYRSLWRLYKGRQGDIWAVVLKGAQKNKLKRLYRYDSLKKLFVSPSFSISGDLLSITDADDSSFWAGSFSGLLRIDKDKGVTQTLDLQSAVRGLHRSPSGILWIGTYGRGVFSYNVKTGRLKNYTEDDGLCNNKVLNIEEDRKGNIWVSTCNGITKLNPTTRKFANFYAADGLQSNQFYYNASARLSTGELLFGGIKGFNLFAPDSIRQFHDFPQLIISGLRIANTPADVTGEAFPGSKNYYNIDHIVLPYDMAIISIDYAALEYSLPQKIQYAYQLVGRDRNWYNAGSLRTINYSHLNEGNYVLKIRSTNTSGFWNPAEKRIYITVRPPLYKSWWAYLCYFLLLSSAIYGYLLYQKKQTRLKLEVEYIKELNQKKIEFFTNISHEFRTPLTLIVNPIKKLLQTDETGTHEVDINAVYRNSRRLLSLVNQLLLFRASEDEITAFQPAIHDLKEICAEVFHCFTNQVKSKEISYQFVHPDEPLMLYADREKLEVILFNLLSNAIKYTPARGAVTLSIAADEQSVYIAVEDNGPGIPPETGNKLFDKFYRIRNEQEVIRTSGFGIGLFLAKKFAIMHSGDLTYQSEIGKGSIFTVILPIKELYTDKIQPSQSSILLEELFTDVTQIPETQYSTQDDVGEIMSDVVNQKPMVLLLDDDYEMRSYIKTLLQDEYHVCEAADTATGISLVQKTDPDLIVCDVMMKGDSGVEFCTKIKASTAFSQIPVILLTGSSSPDIKLKGIECGADDYITKPFESELLLARIKSILKGRDTLKTYFFNEITLKSNNHKIPAEYSEFLAKCISIMEDHLDGEDFSIKTFTDELGMSRSTLFRKIKSISGLSSGEFIRYIRLRKAAELMIQTDMQIKEVAFRVGFQDIKHFREQFNKLFKMNPSEFISKHRKTFSSTHHLGSGITKQRQKDNG